MDEGGGNGGEAVGEQGQCEADGGTAAGDRGLPPGNPFQPADPPDRHGGWQADQESIDDLVNQIMTRPDTLLMGVYGDTLHRNDGHHLHGGISEVVSHRHMDWLDRVGAHGHNLIHPRRCAVRKQFVSTLAKFFRGVLERKWNSELALIYAACILRRSHGTYTAKGCKCQCATRMALWDDGRIEALFTQIETAAIHSAGQRRSELDGERTGRVYNSTVLDGNIRSAVRRLTARSGGGVMAPNDLCTKTGRPVLKVL